VITYHGIGYWAVLTLIPAAILYQLLPAGTRVRRLVGHALIAALLLIAATVGLSY
jgi:hypothetical protein